MTRKQIQREYLTLEDLPNIPGAASSLYQYEGFWHCPCVCGLQTGELTDGRNFIVFTELPQNEGTSVTNMVERLVTWVVSMRGYDPANTVIIEHYPKRGEEICEQETWDLVLPEWVNGIARVPNEVGRWMWKHMTAAEAKALLGIVEVTP